MPLPRIIILVGPTASGKTTLSLALARAFSGEVISADSRTIYKEMDIGTAKPGEGIEGGKGIEGNDRDRHAGPDSPAVAGLWARPESNIYVDNLKIAKSRRDVGAQHLAPTTGKITDMFREKPLMYEDIPHWGFNLRNPDEVFTVSEYQAYADQKITEIIKRGNTPILVGGTGLYVAAVVDRPSFAEVPPDPALRLELATKTNAELLEEIAEKDPDTAEKIDAKNRRRLERALEILRATGKRLAEVQTRGEPLYDVCIIGIDVPREMLYERIDTRIDAMIGEGLVDEVRMLRKKYGDNAPGMTGIGYRQIGAFLRGECTLKEAILTLKHDTHQYAKRQITWFQRDKRIHWVKDTKEALEYVDAWMNLS